MRLAPRSLLPTALLLTFAAACDDDTETAGSSTDGSSASGGGGDATTSGSGGAGSATAGTGGGPCDDSGPDPNQHTAGTCSNLGETSLVAYCDVAIDELDPGVAYAAISCLANACLEGPGCTTDEYRAAAIGCLVDALADACPDAGADVDCEAITAACSASSAECHAHLDGMVPSARDEVVTCATDACTGGLRGCVEAALSPG